MSTNNVGTSTFSVRLLQSILPLTPEQQKELVTELATNPNFSKGKFKSLAENYQSRNEMGGLAIQSNEASGAVVPMTMVSYAELVWERSKEGKNLFDIGVMLGWTEAKTKQYSALSAICKEAWDIIVTTFEGDSSSTSEDAVTKEVTVVTFTEFLLREILDLFPTQQLELVQELATNKKFTKGMFKTRAENYQTRNEAKKYALEKLGNLGEPYTTKTLISNSCATLQLVSTASISLWMAVVASRRQKQ